MLDSWKIKLLLAKHTLHAGHCGSSFVFTFCPSEKWPICLKAFFGWKVHAMQRILHLLDPNLISTWWFTTLTFICIVWPFHLGAQSQSFKSPSIPMTSANFPRWCLDANEPKLECIIQTYIKSISYHTTGFNGSQYLYIILSTLHFHYGLNSAGHKKRAF